MPSGYLGPCPQYDLLFLSVPRNSSMLSLCQLNGRRTDGVQLHMVQLWSAKSSECQDSYSVDPDSPVGPALGKTFFVRISVGMISVRAPRKTKRANPWSDQLLLSATSKTRSMRRRITLGTRAQIPTGHIVKTLRAQATCDSNVPSDQMLGTF